MAAATKTQKKKSQRNTSAPQQAKIDKEGNARKTYQGHVGRHQLCLHVPELIPIAVGFANPRRGLHRRRLIERKRMERRRQDQ